MVERITAIASRGTTHEPDKPLLVVEDLTVSYVPGMMRGDAEARYALAKKRLFSRFARPLAVRH